MHNNRIITKNDVPAAGRSERIGAEREFRDQTIISEVLTT